MFSQSPLQAYLRKRSREKATLSERPFAVVGGPSAKDFYHLQRAQGEIRAEFSLASCMFSSSQLSFRSSNRTLVQEKGNDFPKKPRCRGVQTISDYLGLFFINIFLLHIPGHSKVCHFTRFFFSNQHVTGGEVSVNYLTDRKNNQLKMLRSRFYNRDDTTGLSWNFLMLPLFHKFNNFQQLNLAFKLLVFKMRSQISIT